MTGLASWYFPEPSAWRRERARRTEGTRATWRQEIEKRLNDLLDRVLSLITALDMMEVDYDLEDTADDEPSLGWGHRGGQSFLAGTAPNLGHGDTCDLELDNCDDEDGHDAEGYCPEDYGEIRNRCAFGPLPHGGGPFIASGSIRKS
jgi:hypothetical protein